MGASPFHFHTARQPSRRRAFGKAASIASGTGARVPGTRCVPTKPDRIDYLTLQLDSGTVALNPHSAGKGSRQEMLPTDLFRSGEGAVHNANGKKLEIGGVPPR